MKLRNYSKAKSYSEILKMHTVQELSAFASAWKISGRSKMKKDALIKGIIQVIDMEFDSVCLSLNKEHILLMESPNALPKDPAFQTMEMKELMGLGLLFQGQEAFHVYPKWQERLNEIYDKYPGAIENNSFVKLCIETIIAYRGLILKAEAIEVIQEISNNELPADLIGMILDYTIGRTKNVYESDGYYHDHRLNDISDRVKILETSTVSKVYPISLEDVVYYSKNYYVYKGQAFEAFMATLMPKYVVNIYEAIHVLDQMNLMIAYGYKPSDFMRMMAGNFKITDGAQLKSMADACMAFYNEMPQWLIKGFAPNQLADLKATPVKKSEKISRNAPCPCGSGKKYKQCCIN